MCSVCPCIQYLWTSGVNQEVGSSIPALVDGSLSKTLNPELLLVSVFTVDECNMIVSRFGYKRQLNDV